MEVNTQMSANQLWKQQKASGMTNLDFKTWLNQQKAKGWSNVIGTGTIPVNTALDPSVQAAINDVNVTAGEESAGDTQYLFGIPTINLIYVGIGLGVLGISIFLYKKIRRS
jgi:hypothetical protein